MPQSSPPRGPEPADPPAARPAGPAPPGPDPVLPRVARGDEAAVRECLARYAGLVWALARRFVGNPADAEDAVQEIFVDLWRSAGRFDPGRASEPTFVALVARRRLVDGRRRAARRPAPGPLPADLPGRAPDAAAGAAAADDVARAGRALAALRPDQRAAIELAVLHGLTHEQVAARTGQPLGTVKSHIRRGLIAVRSALAAGPAEGGGG